MKSRCTDQLKPFLKWAGGKSQLLDVFDRFFPAKLKKGQMKKYFEPFVGGGAVFFHIKQNFSVKESFIYDINPELILVYQVIKHDVEKLINILARMKEHYLPLDEKGREAYFYDLRRKFNECRELIDFDNYGENWISRAAWLIFMNKTCYNGLFRVNKSGFFNVPFGRYKNPGIFSRENLLNISNCLRETKIGNGDYSKIASDVCSGSFVYLDPPYRPISKTSSFTSYSCCDFDDTEQERLAEFFRSMDSKGVMVMLSNSDPKNRNQQDDFFEKLYRGYNIFRVPALRMINSRAEKRGKINELIITNYEVSA